MLVDNLGKILAIMMVKLDCTMNPGGFWPSLVPIGGKFNVRGLFDVVEGAAPFGAAWSAE